MAAHCGAEPYRVTFEGEVPVAEEETHGLSTDERIAQTRTLQSSDHTSWVEGQAPYGESGVAMSTEGDVSLYDREHGARSRTTSIRTERHLEYECGEGVVDEDPADGSPPAEPSEPVGIARLQAETLWRAAGLATVDAGDGRPPAQTWATTWGLALLGLITVAVVAFFRRFRHLIRR